ncbi:MAG: carboxypeptidase-like regulatory domain-containing protein [Acidobacteria bacterium]|nr:carboxypeptidase-like regulatory domain-containing protein [Acidobacteriota bacterium]
MSRWIGSVLACTLLLAPAWPQASSGTVSGTVCDQSGAVIPNTAVVVVNTATNVTSITRTNEAGFCIVPGLIPGPYRVTVEAPWMQKYEGTFITQTGYSPVTDPVMKPAQAVTTVEVTDVTPMVTTDNAIVRDTVDRARIDQLPINGRSLNTLLAILPGADTGAGEVDTLGGGMYNRAVLESRNSGLTGKGELHA